MISTFTVKFANLLSNAKYSQIDRAEQLIQAGYLPIYDCENKSIKWVYAIVDKENIFGSELTMNKVNKDTAKAIYDLLDVKVDL